jgi:hypothetical protein
LFLQNWRAGGQNRSCLGELVPVWGRIWGKGVEGSIWCKSCAQMCVNGKMRLAETVPGMVAKGVKENGGGLNSSMIYLIYLIYQIQV